jgi:uncharacterized caspase-like protein
MTLALLLLAPAAPAQDPKPPLWAVCIGVSRHQHASLDAGVQYAAKDAADVANLLTRQEGKVFGRVECKVLTDAQATCAGVEKALAWLRASARPGDCTIVYLAGHAGPDAVGEYRFIPYDAHPLLDSTQLSGAALRKLLQQVSGTRFLMLDTCHAGGVGGPDAGFVTLASCSARQQSHEHPSVKNGYFTRALVEALSGKADLNGDQVVTLAELGTYLSGRLRELSEGKQEATVQRPASVKAEFPLAMVSSASAAPPPAVMDLSRRDGQAKR